MDNLDFLDSPEGENADAQPENVEAVEQETAERPTQEQETEKPSQPRGPDGKFASKKADEPVMVPLAALHEARDKARELEARIAAQQPQQVQQAPQIPDLFENPEGFVGALQGEMQSKVYQSNLQWSERLASIEHGADLVAQAKEWGTRMCDVDPYFNARVAATPDPYSFVVQAFKQTQAATTFADVPPNEYKQFKAWKADQAAKAAPPPVPTTLADAQSARGAAPAGIKPPSLDEILRGKVTT